MLNAGISSVTESICLNIVQLFGTIFRMQRILQLTVTFQLVDLQC